MRVARGKVHQHYPDHRHPPRHHHFRKMVGHDMLDLDEWGRVRDKMLRLHTDVTDSVKGYFTNDYDDENDKNNYKFDDDNGDVDVDDNLLNMIM